MNDAILYLIPPESMEILTSGIKTVTFEYKHGALFWHLYPSGDMEREFLRNDELVRVWEPHPKFAEDIIVEVTSVS